MSTPACAAAEDHRDIFLVANRSLELVEDLDEWMGRTAQAREWLEGFIRSWQKSGAIDASVKPAVTARVLLDALDRAAKAYIVFGDRSYGRDLCDMFRRGLAARAC
jgi:hypothetical protein